MADLARQLMDAHTRSGTEITIAFLTEKDGQMGEKRRKKWRPFCFAHLRGDRGELYVCSFFWEKNRTKTNARGRVLWPWSEKFSRPLRDAVTGVIFFNRHLVMKKITWWRFCAEVNTTFELSYLLQSFNLLVLLSTNWGIFYFDKYFKSLVFWLGSR